MPDSDDDFGWSQELEQEFQACDEFGWSWSADNSLLDVATICDIQPEQRGKSSPTNSGLSKPSGSGISENSSSVLAPTSSSTSATVWSGEADFCAAAASKRAAEVLVGADRVEDGAASKYNDSPSAAIKSASLPYSWQFVRADGKLEYSERLKLFSYKLYRGPNDERVQVHYCTTRVDCEAVAQLFLNEAVLGFDMEWKAWDCRNGPTCKRKKCHDLQQKISLIQVASGSDIALFHLGVMPGSKVVDLIAPSLRKLIETPKIIKTGVAVNKADGSRLRRYFKLKPQGLIELGELHRLVKYWPGNLHEATSKGLTSLKNLTATHLGKPLDKNHKVRASDWSRPLSPAHVEYAANDAYVGFQLYRWLELKRRKMAVQAPHPHFAETYKKINPADYGFGAAATDEGGEKGEGGGCPTPDGLLERADPKADKLPKRRTLLRDVQARTPVKKARRAATASSAAAVEERSSSPAFQTQASPPRKSDGRAVFRKPRVVCLD